MGEALKTQSRHTVFWWPNVKDTKAMIAADLAAPTVRVGEDFQAIALCEWPRFPMLQNYEFVK